MHASVTHSTLLQDRFAATLLGLCEEAGVHGQRDRLMAPLLALLCRRLYGVMAQVTRTLARLQAGRLPVRRKPGTARVRMVSDGVAGDAAMPVQAGGLRLRYGWAWMIRMAPRVAQYAPQIQLLFDEPEMQAALAASPSLRRALRPLCRGLAFPVPPVMVEAKARGLGAPGGPAGTGLAIATPDEGEMPSSLRPAVARRDAMLPSRAGSSIAIANHDRSPRPTPGRGARDSPGAVRAVLRLFTR